MNGCFRLCFIFSLHKFQNSKSTALDKLHFTAFHSTILFKNEIETRSTSNRCDFYLENVHQMKSN